MSIIKNGRINIWNAVKKQFEVVHPETETARITDFADGIVQKLALTSAMTAVTALQTNSWFGQLLKLVLNASGMKYLISQNGYICFGSLFGGLILQWGHAMTKDEYYRRANFPIAFPAEVFMVFSTMGALGNDTNAYGCVWNYEETTKTIVQFRTTNLLGNPWFLAVGK